YRVKYNKLILHGSTRVAYPKRVHRFNDLNAVIRHSLSDNQRLRRHSAAVGIGAEYPPFSTRRTLC
ncbi:MAG: hypothetical protein IKK49_02735, partial [Clostridia bacterium]|nr:hypothetical protein [Clostridia bacterium]